MRLRASLEANVGDKDRTARSVDVVSDGENPLSELDTADVRQSATGNLQPPTSVQFAVFEYLRQRLIAERSSSDAEARVQHLEQRALEAEQECRQLQNSPSNVIFCLASASNFPRKPTHVSLAANNTLRSIGVNLTTAKPWLWKSLRT